MHKQISIVNLLCVTYQTAVLEFYLENLLVQSYIAPNRLLLKTIDLLPNKTSNYFWSSGICHAVIHGRHRSNRCETFFVPVWTGQEDVPGAKLVEPLETHTIWELSWWIECRGHCPPPTSASKTVYCREVRKIMAANLPVIDIDSENVLWCEQINSHYSWLCLSIHPRATSWQLLKLEVPRSKLLTNCEICLWTVRITEHAYSLRPLLKGQSPLRAHSDAIMYFRIYVRIYASCMYVFTYLNPFLYRLLMK